MVAASSAIFFASALVILSMVPVKTIDFNATVLVTGSLDINLAEYDENFDIVAFLADVLSVDSYNGDVVVNGFEVDDANEY